MPFVPRLSETSPTAMRGNRWWYSSGNIFYPSYGLPNCTCYAYGRYAEVRGAFANLPGGNATTWYDTVGSNFKKGQEPALGAIICWSTRVAGYGGHVAVVEEIHDNGDIVTSNSAWKSTYFYTQTITKASGYAFIGSRPYYFRGFIYNDGYDPGTGVDVHWSAKETGPFITWDSNLNVISNAEADGNIISAWLVYQELGWSMEAVAAVLGVQCYESGLNPWRWQSDQVLSSTDTVGQASTVHGYGLNQFTPFNTYKQGAQGYFPSYAPHFSDVAGSPDDGDSQCRFVHKACTQLGYYFKWSWGDYSVYPYMDFETFHTTNVTDFENLVTQWLQNYSRGIPEHNQSFEMRVAGAEYCYNLIRNYKPGGKTSKHWPLWMYLHYGL